MAGNPAEQTRGARRQPDAAAKGFDPEHPFVEDLKLKDFISSVRYTDKEVCDPKFILEFANSCRKISPLVRFVTTSLELEW